jgi:hypothetical protein
MDEVGGRGPWAVGAVALVVFLGVFLAAGAAFVDHSGSRVQRIADGRVVSVGKSWPGPFDSCVVDVDQPVLPNCYREPVARNSIIKEPLSVASALAYSFVGLAILWWAGLERNREATTDRFTSSHQAWFGFVALAMGPGSILFHGTLTAWGGWFDQVSMYLLLAFMAAYNLMRWKRLGDASFALIYGAFVVVTGIVAAFAGGFGLYVFIATAVLVGVFEVVALLALLPAAGFLRSRPRLWIAVAVLALSLVPWFASNPRIGGDPTTVPYHLMWHILSACFVAAYFVYLCSERALPQVSSAEKNSMSR